MTHGVAFGTIIQNGAYGTPFVVAGSSEEGCYLKIEWVPVSPPGVPSSEGAQVKWSSRRYLAGGPLNPNGDRPPSMLTVTLRGEVKTTCVCVDKKTAANPGGNLLPLDRQGASHGTGLDDRSSAGGAEYWGITAWKYNPANGHCPPGPDGQCKGGPRTKKYFKTHTYKPSDFKGEKGECLAGAAGCTENSWRDFQNRYQERAGDGPAERVVMSQSSGLGRLDAGWELARAALGKAMLDALKEGTTQIDCNLGQSY